MCRERRLCNAIENRFVNLARNLSGPELVFDPAVKFENVLMRIAHLLRNRSDRIRARTICDIAGVSAADIDHDWFMPLQYATAAHHRDSRIKATNANRPIE